MRLPLFLELAPDRCTGLYGAVLANKARFVTWYLLRHSVAARASTGTPVRCREPAHLHTYTAAPTREDFCVSTCSGRAAATARRLAGMEKLCVYAHAAHFVRWASKRHFAALAFLPGARDEKQDALAERPVYRRNAAAGRHAGLSINRLRIMFATRHFTCMTRTAGCAATPCPLWKAA